MKLRFVCEPYRQQMYKNKSMAIHCWQDSFDTGLYLFEQMLWHDALPHLGRAHVASEIILTTNAMPKESACEIFTASSLSLLSTMANLGYKDECIEIYQKSRARLKQATQCSKGLRFWLAKFDEQVREHDLHPSRLNQFTGMAILNRQIMPLDTTIH